MIRGSSCVAIVPVLLVANLTTSACPQTVVARPGADGVLKPVCAAVRVKVVDVIDTPKRERLGNGCHGDPLRSPLHSYGTVGQVGRRVRFAAHVASIEPLDLDRNQQPEGFQSDPKEALFLPSCAQQGGRVTELNAPAAKKSSKAGPLLSS